MKKILIYRLGSMGDTLVALPCLHSLRRWYPDSHITWLTNLPVNEKARAATDLLKGTGLIDEYISYPMGTRALGPLLALRSALKQQQFDLVVHLAASRGFVKSIRDLLFLRSIGARQVVGVPWKQNELHSLPLPDGSGLYEHESVRLARRLKPLGGIELANRDLWSLKITPVERQEAQERLQAAGIRGPFITISIGTKSNTNDWTQQRWLQMLEQAGSNLPGAGLVVIGAPDEKERSAELLAGWPGPTLNLAGVVTVREAAAVMAGSRLFIGHDSGPMHLAASQNIPCIAVFSARNRPGTWYPGGPGHRVFYEKTECFGCGLSVCTAHGKKCILSIQPDTVAQAVLEKFNLISPPSSVPA